MANVPTRDIEKLLNEIRELKKSRQKILDAIDYMLDNDDIDFMRAWIEGDDAAEFKLTEWREVSKNI